MPIYEYKCDECGCEFEELVLKSNEEIKCHLCESLSVRKLMSATSSCDMGDGPGGGLSSIGNSCGGGGGFS